ncbi:MAG: hypothetical protein COB37_12130, partial [Kordiimonadales bacterium]
EILSERKGAAAMMLHFNENSLGMSPKAIKAAQLAVASAGNRYPDDAVAELTDKLAAKHQVPADWIVLGNGSTEVLASIVTMLATGGGVVVEPTPTFGAMRGYAAAEGVPVISVPVNADFTTNLGALRATADKISGTVLINLCDANNPTGTICDHAELLDWVTNAPENQLFLLDEAYVDYALLNPAFRSLLPLVRDGKENLIIARTFSKVYGMAGMRVGYAVAAPATMKKLRPFTASYNLSAAGVAAAMASLEDTEFYQKSLKSNETAKAILIKALDALSLNHIPASTNFVLHRINSPVADYQRRMKANGILVGRRMTKEDGWNRISVGTPAEMLAFAKTLQAFRNKSWV